MVFLLVVGSHYKACNLREKENPCGFSSGLLLGVLVVELAGLSAIHVVNESNAGHDQRCVEGNELNGVVLDPVKLDFLGLAVSLEHFVLLVVGLITIDVFPAIPPGQKLESM
jgi:hypothetical protein